MIRIVSGPLLLGLLLAVGIAAPAASADGEWRTLDLGPEAVCADGTAVTYLERVVDRSRVVLYLEGGGACFSAQTCAFTGPDKSYVSSSRMTPRRMARLGGIFDATNSDNPLAGHSFVYVPYCTGDVHLGTQSTTYSDDLTIEHRGHTNAVLALDHLVATFPDATELVVAGASAGAVPTPLFAGLVADRLPDARIMALADSSGAYPDDPVLNAFIGALWGSMDAVPDWPETEGISVSDWGIPSLYEYAGRHAPDITFARFDYAFDEVQALYGGLVGVEPDSLVGLIDQNETGIEAAGVEVASYVAPGSLHTVIRDDSFYEMAVDGVRLVDWVKTLVEGGSPGDVHCIDCE